MTAAGAVDRHMPVALTEAGGRVLAGEADHAALNGVDRWIGGVHLLGMPAWRWDEGKEAIVGGSPRPAADGYDSAAE